MPLCLPMSPSTTTSDPGDLMTDEEACADTVRCPVLPPLDGAEPEPAPPPEPEGDPMTDADLSDVTDSTRCCMTDCLPMSPSPTTRDQEVN